MHLIYCFLIIIIFIATAFSNGDEVTVFDVGQGNCVLVKHKKQGILIDAGSKENNFSTLYNRLFGYDVKRRYRLREDLESSSNSNSLSDVDTDTEDEKSTTPESSIEEEKVDIDKKSTTTSTSVFVPKVDKKLTKSIIFIEEEGAEVDTEKGPSSNSTPTIKKIRSTILKNNDGVLLLKTVVISHPDIDHYNLLPDIFNDDIEFKINSIILGGRWQQYSDSMQNWLKIHYYNDDATHKIEDVIFTGTIDGSNMDNKEYARAYGSIFKENTRSDVEKKIEQALQFDGTTVEKPLIKILAMNVGYKESFDIESNGEEKKDSANTSSIVLRVEGKASFTITGDADGCTWDFIEGSYQGETGPLETDYLLLSHHGALRHGPSRETILSILKPKVCLISTGRIGRPYFHPRGEIIDRLINLGSLKKFCTTYPFSYYKVTAGGGDPVRQRKYYKEMICSTLDDGHITFKLIPPAEINKICVTRNRKKFLEDSDQDTYFKLDETNQQPIQYNPNKKAQQQGSLSKAFKEVDKRENNGKKNEEEKKVKYFYRHSLKYNLILPAQENFIIEAGDVYYLQDFINNQIYKIKIDN